MFSDLILFFLNKNNKILLLTINHYVFGFNKNKENTIIISIFVNNKSLMLSGLILFQFLLTINHCYFRIKNFILNSTAQNFIFLHIVIQ